LSRREGWEPVDHACRFCGGRVAQRGQTFECFHCGARTERGVVADICGCGLEGANGQRPFACQPNSNRTPQNPAVIVIARADPLAAAKERA
jgi:hypothetical protein